MQDAPTDTPIQRAPSPTQRVPTPTNVSLDAHHPQSSVVLHSPLPAPQNRQLILTSGPQAPGMPIILAPRPLLNQEAKSDDESSMKRPGNLPLQMTSTEITNEVPEKEADAIEKTGGSEVDEKKNVQQEKMPKIMTNTVYDI